MTGWGLSALRWKPLLALCALLFAVLAAAAPLYAQEKTAPRQVTIFAAASTVSVMNAVAAAFQAQSGVEVRPVYASSSTLARQIAQGAPADLFLSASGDWMDFLAARGALESGTRVELLTNRLVLIAPAERAFALEVGPGFELERALGEGRLALGDPGHVPAGIYAKHALERLGVWAGVRDRLALAADVRGALALVERGEAAAGMVYETDAAIARGVVIAGRFPPQSHPPILYPLAVMAGRQSPAAEDFHAFLQGATARAIFRAQGFGLAGVPSLSGAGG